MAAQGLALQGFLAAHGFLAAQGFFAAHGFFAAQGLAFLAAQGLAFFAAQGFLAAQGFWAKAAGAASASPIRVASNAERVAGRDGMGSFKSPRWMGQSTGQSKSPMGLDVKITNSLQLF
ncbi:MAG: hypothetical protein K2X51_03055 [Burkholderiales bacterium]|nr:hypothetical protein [Burkholderiales bacterium]